MVIFEAYHTIEVSDIHASLIELMSAGRAYSKKQRPSNRVAPRHDDFIGDIDAALEEAGAESFGQSLHGG